MDTAVDLVDAARRARECAIVSSVRLLAVGLAGRTDPGWPADKGGQAPEPGDADWRWLAIEAAAASLEDMGADEVFSRVWESQEYPVCVAFKGDSPVEYWDEEEPEKPAPFVLKNVNRRLAALGREPT